MLELVVLGATFALAAGASGAQLHRRIAAARALERYATWRAHGFVPAPDKKASPRVEGAKDGVAFVIDLYRGGGHVRTRVVAAVQRGVPPKIAVVQRHALARTLAHLPGELRLGVASFDRAYRILGATSDEARAWALERSANLMLLDERTDVRLTCDGARVTLSWSGIEKNPLFFDAARDLVVGAASWHVPEAPYR